MRSLASPPSARRIQRVRHELLRREVRVCRIEAPTPGFLAITFAGGSLSSFVSLGFDDHVKFIFTDAAGQTCMRDYTPCAYQPGSTELTLEFALHAQGAASDWARNARVGDTAVIGGPKGSMVVPMDYDWHMLAGDTSALPAIQRRLAELPRQARAWVFVQAEDPRDQRPLPSQAAVELQWLPSSTALLQALRAAALPAGEGFVWCAGEASVMARVRDLLLGERQLPRDHARISAYWKAGAADFHEAL